MKILNVGIALVALVALLIEPVAGAPLMAYTVITNSDVSALWKTAQGKLMPGFNFVTKEFGWVKEMKELKIAPSLRSMTFPVDFQEDRGITSLPDGGREAEPMTQNAVDATVSFIHLNGRFTVSKRARWALDTDAKAAISHQLKWEGKKKIEALGRVASDMFYGYSTNYLAVVDDSGGALTGSTSHTITLKNALNDSAIDGSSTAEKNYIANLFKVGDRVALIASAALVTNSAFGEVTAVTKATPSIAVTWTASVDPDDGDQVVFSNGATGTAIAHTSYNRGLVGIRDICTTDTVHNISTATHPNWSVAYSDTAAGRFTGEKWRRGLDEIQNDGHEDASVVTLMSKGVRRDVAAQYSA